LGSPQKLWWMLMQRISSNISMLCMAGMMPPWCTSCYELAGPGLD
jgi:hypothetical protein